MIPLDKLSRSKTVAYEIPCSLSGIYNTKSLCITLVQVAPNHFVPTWDEVDFLKVEVLSCGQFVHRHKTQTFNFYTNYVEVISVFLFSYLCRPFHLRFPVRTAVSRSSKEAQPLRSSIS